MMPNPWDVGSARALAAMGFEALATSSGASAAALGRRDGELSRDDALAHARMIARRTDLPVAGDLENGFGDSPDDVAETIRLAAGAGLVGGSIEDFSGNKTKNLYDIASCHGTRRGRRGKRRARLPFEFTLTARAENYLRGNPDLDDTIRRLRRSKKPAPTCCLRPVCRI